MDYQTAARNSTNQQLANTLVEIWEANSMLGDMEKSYLAEAAARLVAPIRVNAMLDGKELVSFMSSQLPGYVTTPTAEATPPSCKPSEINS
jgi:hypothetical protein